MATIQINGYLQAWNFDRSPNGAVSWGFSDNDFEHENLVAKLPYTIETDVPELNVVALKVAALKQAEDKALTEYQKRVASIREQLSKLQALEFAA